MAASETPDASAWKPSYNPWLIAASVMLATFMEVLDTSVANVSLPHIAGNLSATTDEATWVLTSYLVANAIILPATNWLGNLFGRKRFLVTCIMLFTFASALCGAATSLGFLVIARVLQGAAGGALQPISQAVLLESFPPARRGAAMAVFAMGVVVAPILGPTLGGWITDNYSWRWVFYINLPIGLIAWLMVNSFIEDPPYLKRVSASNIDYLGFGFLAIWLATLQFVLDKGQELDWFGSHTIAWCLAISVIAFGAFVVRELTAEQPLVDLRVLKNRNLAVGCVLIGILGALLYGTTAVLPLFMQNLLHYTALDAGLALSPRGVGAFLATIVVGRLVGKVSNRILIACGFLGLAYSSFLFGRINLSIGMSSIVWPVILSGISISFIFVPLATSSMGTLQQDQIGNASGLFNLMRNLGGSVGIAGLTTLVARGAQSNQATFVGHFSQYSPVYQQKLAAIQQGLAGREDAWTAAHQAPQILYGILGQQSLLVTYAHNFRLFGILCLVTMPLVFFFKKVRKAKGPIAAH
ncbi:MAG: DHA2 family efflux MFS transporter permease subunit [Chthoniobacterales bacterium]